MLFTLTVIIQADDKAKADMYSSHNSHDQNALAASLSSLVYFCKKHYGSSRPRHRGNHEKRADFLSVITGLPYNVLGSVKTREVQQKLDENVFISIGRK